MKIYRVARSAAEHEQFNAGYFKEYNALKVIDKDYTIFRGTEVKQRRFFYLDYMDAVKFCVRETRDNNSIFVFDIPDEILQPDNCGISLYPNSSPTSFWCNQNTISRLQNEYPDIKVNENNYINKRYFAIELLIPCSIIIQYLTNKKIVTKFRRAKQKNVILHSFLINSYKLKDQPKKISCKSETELWEASRELLLLSGPNPTYNEQLLEMLEICGLENLTEPYSNNRDFKHLDQLSEEQKNSIFELTLEAQKRATTENDIHNQLRLLKK